MTGRRKRFWLGLGIVVVAGYLAWRLFGPAADDPRRVLGPAPKLELCAALDQPITLDVRGEPLAAVLEKLRGLTGATLTIDTDEPRDDATTRVDLKVTGVPARAVVDHIAWQCFADNPYVVVYETEHGATFGDLRADNLRRFRHTYDIRPMVDTIVGREAADHPTEGAWDKLVDWVRGLFAGSPKTYALFSIPAKFDTAAAREQTREALEDVVVTMIDPDHWHRMGGLRHRLGTLDGLMNVTAPPPVQRRVYELLGAVWQAEVRGISTPNVAATSRAHQLAVAAMNTPRPLGTGDPQPLGVVLFEMAETYGVNVSIRRFGLTMQGVELDMPVRFDGTARTFDQALNAISRQLGVFANPGRLTAYPDAAGVVRVTAGESPGRPRIGVYALNDLAEQLVANRPGGPFALRSEDAKRQFVNRVGGEVRAGVQPESWMYNGGLDARLMPLTRSLVIRADAKTHAEVRALLRNLRDAAKITE